jgi:hypothetical protein
MLLLLLLLLPAGAAVGLGGECVWLVWHDEGEVRRQQQQGYQQQ